MVEHENTGGGEVEEEEEEPLPSEFKRRYIKVLDLLIHGHHLLLPDVIVVEKSIEGFLTVAAEQGFLVGSFKPEIFDQLRVGALDYVMRESFWIWDSELDNYRKMTDDERDPEVVARVRELQRELDNMKLP